MTSIRECWDRYAAEALPGTITGDKSIRIWNHGLKHIEYHDAETLTRDQINAYVAYRNVAPGTINHELGILKAALRYAHKMGLIDKVPYVALLPKPPPRMRVLTRKEAEAMVAAAKQRGLWRDIVYLALALGTGARPGAIMDLTWDRVDQRTIDFRRPMAPMANRMKNRTVAPINSMVASALVLARRHEDGPWVINWAGKKIDNPREMVRRIAKDAKVRNVTPHVLRHTVASLLLQEGVDLLPVSRLLGHSSTVITEQVYFQHPPSWLKQTTDKLKF